MTQRYEFAIIGAGILGLATALELHARQPGARIVVLEREQSVAAHQTGHNSGVIHSGIYYRPGSAKARLCVEGRALLLERLRGRGIPFELCGKLIVALTAAEVSALRDLQERARTNGVGEVAWLGPDEFRSVEPHVRGLAALHVPQSGIVDFGAVARDMAAELTASGVEIRTGEEVVDVLDVAPSVRLRTANGTVEANRAIACAGLWSDRLATKAGAAKDPRIVPFRGDYYVLRPERRDLVRGLVYPVPDPRFPFLGIHFTRRIDGDVWLGPNAVLAFARAGYRMRDVDLGDTIDAIGYRGFRALARRYWRTGLAEIFRDVSTRAFLSVLRRYVPEIAPDDLLPGPSGVRAQAIAPDGAMLDDFAFDLIGRLLNVRNAPSPAATSSLALARVFADRLLAAS